MRERWRLVPLFLLLSAADAALAHWPVERKNPRRSKSADLSLPLERFVLGNGLVVLLSPDPTGSSVSTALYFRAGALYEPPQKSGLAHFVEHALYEGPTPDTRYARLLESRRARSIGAYTTADTMSFHATVPTEELALALWVHADRLRTLPGLIDDAGLGKHYGIIREERALRTVDEAYGLVDERLYAQVFPPPHPLHGALVGVPAELEAIRAKDVLDFVERHMVPANGVLVLAGRFDPAAARKLVEEHLGTLARRPAPGPLALPDLGPRHGVLQDKEVLSRQPRVTMIWNLAEVTERAFDELVLGATLLSVYTDGAFGTRVAAGVMRMGKGALFRLDVMLPHDKPIPSAQNEAEAFSRYLTHAAMPDELIDAAFLAFDRHLLESLGDPEARSRVLAQLELEGADLSKVLPLLEQHWTMRPQALQETARKLLVKDSLIVMHARPVRPRQPKVERQ